MEFCFLLSALVSAGYLDKPLLYLSSLFEENKALYYDNLTRVRDNNDLLQWLKYFLVGIEKTSKTACDTLGKILGLKEKYEIEIRTTLGRKVTSGLTLMSALFQNPVIRVKDVQTICRLSPKAAGALVADFEKLGILKELTGFSRNRTFVFSDYLSLF